MNNKPYTVNNNEPVIITGENSKNHLKVMIADALIDPSYPTTRFYCNEPDPTYDDMKDFSPVQDCKYPPSQLIMALVHRLK